MEYCLNVISCNPMKVLTPTVARRGNHYFLCDICTVNKVSSWLAPVNVLPCICDNSLSCHIIPGSLCVFSQSDHRKFLSTFSGPH